MRKLTSKWMMMIAAAMLLGGVETVSAQIPLCPPFCQVKATPKAQTKTPKATKANRQKKQKQEKKSA